MSRKLKINLLWLLPILLLLVSLSLGYTGNIDLSTIFELFIRKVQHIGEPVEQLSSVETILWEVRLPRVLLTFLVGSALACSGGVLQAVFRNPIVDPFILGISSGAAFGAALAMLVPMLPVNLSAFIFGVVAVALTYTVSYTGHRTSQVNMILAGIIVSGVFTALLTLAQYLSDPYKLQAIVQWTMGNLHTASWAKLRVASLPILIGLFIIIALRWKLNLLSLDNEEALAIGVNPKILNLVFIGASTMITVSAVAAVGVISLFGLIVPHISRMLFGPNNNIGVFANISIGGCFLLVIDNFSRTVMPFEIPVGVFTMLIGAPIFIFLMKRNLNNWHN